MAAAPTTRTSFDLLTDETQHLWAIHCRRQDNLLSIGALVIMPGAIQSGTVTLYADQAEALSVIIPDNFVSRHDRVSVYNAALIIV